MLDLVCHRYPQTRPSQLLQLDEWTGFQFDSALALRSDLLDKDFSARLVHTLIEAIAMVARSSGAKVKVPDYKPIIDEADPDELPTLEEALSKLGGKGVKIEIR